MKRIGIYKIINIYYLKKITGGITIANKKKKPLNKVKIDVQQVKIG